MGAGGDCSPGTPCCSPRHPRRFRTQGGRRSRCRARLGPLGAVHSPGHDFPVKQVPPEKDMKADAEGPSQASRRRCATVTCHRRICTELALDRTAAPPPPPPGSDICSRRTPTRGCCRLKSESLACVLESAIASYMSLSSPINTYACMVVMTLYSRMQPKLAEQKVTATPNLHQISEIIYHKFPKPFSGDLHLKSF